VKKIREMLLVNDRNSIAWALAVRILRLAVPLLVKYVDVGVRGPAGKLIAFLYIKSKTEAAVVPWRIFHEFWLLMTTFLICDPESKFLGDPTVADGSLKDVAFPIFFSAFSFEKV
jgi:hypothetical protein